MFQITLFSLKLVSVQEEITPVKTSACQLAPHVHGQGAGPALPAGRGNVGAISISGWGDKSGLWRLLNYYLFLAELQGSFRGNRETLVVVATQAWQPPGPNLL